MPKLTKQFSDPTSLNSQEEIRILMVVDPCGDLPDAQKECLRIEKELKNSPISDLLNIELLDSSLTPTDIRLKMRDGAFHIIHYAGHVIHHYPGKKPGWLLEGDIDEPNTWKILDNKVLETLWKGKNAPILVFANACNSGRAFQVDVEYSAYHKGFDALAHSLLRAGISHYIGTIWPVPEIEATIDFASAFYRDFFAGTTISQSVHAARNYCAKKYSEEDLTWARYVLFGDPLFRLVDPFLH